jgi:mono/diheme cytochrome c family protein
LKILIILTLTFLIPLGVYAQPDGEKLYNDWCAQCHGYDGDGKGYASGIYSLPQPRDFTLGTYKFRTTPSGDPPLDEDIIRSTKMGNPGTTMPPWTRFTDDEVNEIVEYVKSFEEETFEFEAEPFQIGKAPAVSDELIQKGKEIFDKAKCWECHGKAGRGEGEKGWQEKFKNDWGTRAYPTDLTQSWEYRGGATVEDIYRTVTSGFDGTPMASFQTSYSDEERWALG